MASSNSILVTSILSACDELDLMIRCPFIDITNKHVQEVKYKYLNIKMFVLSTRTTLDINGSLRSLLIKIEAAVRILAKEAHLVGLKGDRPIHKGYPTHSELLELIQPLLEEIDGWYLTVFDDETPRSVSSTTDQLLEIFTTCSECVECFLVLEDIRYPRLDILTRMEVLMEKMTFLKGLICFIKHGIIESTKEFLLHVEAVVIRAAYLLFTFRCDCDFSIAKPAPMKIDMTQFAQKMKLIENVHKSYIQVLRNSKFSKPSSSIASAHHRYMDNINSSVATVNILQYLIYSLWKLLARDAYHVDQLRDLFEGLRSLRKILKQQPTLADMEEIVAVVCDAGVIFSYCESQTKADLGLHDLSQRTARILVELGENPQLPTFNFTMVDQSGFVDFVLEKLSELITSDKFVESTSKGLFQAIHNKLASLRSFLREISELRDTQHELQDLWDQIIEVACKVEDLIDHALAGHFPDSFLNSSFNLIIKDIQSINTDMLKTFHGKGGRAVEVKEITETCHKVSSHRSPSITHEVVGFVDEERSLMDRLPRGSKKLQVIVIVGMPGSGKTTLATKVYNNPSVALYFSVRAWSSISQVLDKKRVLLELLNQIEPDGGHSGMNENDLAEKLWRRLKRRRYLIILDDIWDLDTWYRLKEPFPDDEVGSRIIVTSRHRDVSPRQMQDQEHLSLNPLGDEDSFKLLKSKIFPTNGWTPALLDLLMQFVGRCKGLPLSIVTVAGILANTESEGWKNILDDLTTNNVSSTEQCRNSLDLSYRYLPDHLKSCLLYFGVFQEDEEISTRRLLCLWIAEGFVRKQEMKRALHVAEEHLNELISRSLVMVSKHRWDGRVKRCRMHDLLHEFCLQKAKDEHFLHIIKRDDELKAFNEPKGLRRICIHSEINQFKESTLFCPRARSLLFNKSLINFMVIEFYPDISYVIRIFKLLRVLDLEQMDVGDQFPRELELLVQLSFLAICGSMRDIPPSVDKLWNLETFIVNNKSREPLLFPSSIWNLGKLKYIHIRGAGVYLPLETLDNSSVLHELEFFYGAILPSGAYLERLTRKFPNIREFRYFLRIANRHKIGVPEFLNKLESLKVEAYAVYYIPNVCKLCFPANLKKLTLTSFHLYGESFSILGKLPNLELLSLTSVEFNSGIWEMEEGEFLKLRILKLYCHKLVRWRACDDQLLCLEKLILRRCRSLKEIPSSLKFIPALKKIEVCECPKNVENLVRQIEEEQQNWGNTGLQVVIPHW